MLWRGSRDRAVDMLGRDRGDPFGGHLGFSSRVVINGDTLIQAADWPTIEAMIAGDAENLGDDPDISAVAMALGTEGAGQGSVARVYLAQDGEGAVTAVVDSVHGVTLSGLLALSVVDTEAAEALAAVMERNWTEANSLLTSQPYAAHFDALPVISVVSGAPAVVCRELTGL